jgi:hypothetical protein
MVNVTDNIKPADFMRDLQELENMPEVNFVDRVIGSRDLVIMIETPVTVESIANKIRHQKWVTQVEILRVVSFVESSRSSKSNLLKALSRPVLQGAAAN